jgi:hypothetical protein
MVENATNLSLLNNVDTEIGPGLAEKCVNYQPTLNALYRKFSITRIMETSKWFEQETFRVRNRVLCDLRFPRLVSLSPTFRRNF